MNLVNLVNFIVSWKQREKGYNFEKDTAKAPEIHFVTVVAISEQALWCSIPPGRNIFSVRLLGVDTSTRAKIG